MTDDEAKLPLSWRVARIGELCDLKNGRAFKPSDWTDKGLPIVRIQNLNNPEAPFNHYEGEVRDRFLIEHGNLLFAWSGTPGTSFGAHIWRGGKAVLNQHIFRVDFDERVVDKSYFRFAINNRLTELIEKAHGGVGLRHVTKGKFEETTIPLPPLQEQRRIVAKLEELFSELDKSVESLASAREQIKAYRQSVLKDAFSGRLTQNWRERNSEALESTAGLRAGLVAERQAHHSRLMAAWSAKLEKWEKRGGKGRKPSRVRPLAPVSALSEEVLDTLPSLPAGWAWEKLAWMTCGVEYGTAAKSADSGTTPVIRMGNLQNGRVDWSDLVFTSDKDEIDQYSLEPGDVLFNRTNSPELVGKTAIYSGERRALFAGYLIRVNHNPAVVDGRYLNYFLNSHIARRYGNTVKTDGVNQSNINGEKLQAYPFPFCSLAEQQEVVRLLDEKFSACDKMLSEIVDQLARAEALRQSILTRALSGQLVAHDPSKRPASVPLKRTKAKRKPPKSKKRGRPKKQEKEAA